MQPPQDVGDVGAEDPLVRVQLVQDDKLEALPERLPGRMVRQEREMEQVGIADENVRRLLLELRPTVGRRVAVQDLGPDPRSPREELSEGLQLVLFQGLGRKQEEGAGVGIASQGLQDG